MLDQIKRNFTLWTEHQCMPKILQILSDLIFWTIIWITWILTTSKTLSPDPSLPIVLSSSCPSLHVTPQLHRPYVFFRAIVLTVLQITRASSCCSGLFKCHLLMQNFLTILLKFSIFPPGFFFRAFVGRLFFFFKFLYSLYPALIIQYISIPANLGCGILKQFLEYCVALKMHSKDIL